MRTCHTNKREQETANEHLKKGWQFVQTGFPDFLFYKDLPNGKIEGFFVEVKRKPIPNKPHTNDWAVQLSPIQQETHRVLKGMGFEVKIIYKD